MKISFLSALFAFGSLALAQDHPPAIFTIDGQKYIQPDYRIEKENSKWDFQSSRFPPISLKEAYEKGRNVIHELRPNEPWNLEFTQMMTTKDQAFIDLVFIRDEHLAEEQKQGGSKPAVIVLTVLMDGRILTPTPIK